MSHVKLNSDIKASSETWDANQHEKSNKNGI